MPQKPLTAVFLLTLSIPFSGSAGQNLNYPDARKGSQVETYGGVKVPDPYRWLEDDNSAETTAWVKAENELAASYFNRIPYRQQVKQRLKQLYDFDKYTAPVRRGEMFFFTKKDGLQNQAVLYAQRGLQGSPRVLVDPNKLAADGTTRLMTWTVSKNAKYLAYTVSKGGSDWQDAHVIEIDGSKPLDDHLQWLKATRLAWAGNGFYYSRFPAPAAGQELSSKNEFHTVYYHRLGDPQASDKLVYTDKAHAQRFHVVTTTEDEHFAFLYVGEPGKTGNALFYRDLSKGGEHFVAVVDKITDDQYNPVGNLDGKFLIETNASAPNGRVAQYDPGNSTKPWSEVIPERAEALDAVEKAGGKLFAVYQKDVASHVYVYGLDGKPQNEIHLPGLGSATGFGGNDDDRFVFYQFSSFNYPPAIFRYDIAAKASKVFRAPEIPGFEPDSFETKQVFYRSKDGTLIPMFLVYKKGLVLNGSNPTLLYTYGGFDISMKPTFSTFHLALLEQGFVYASANIRGGSEYGESWHRAGMMARKQNVFDDFISAAEWLVSNKYTSANKLAIHGVSNGGLLVGAVLNQRPALFRAALAQAGVMDMLRFQKFTIGSGWISEFGSSDNPEEFKTLFAYSPIHNIKQAVKYPAVLITTADHDDRVVPGHSFKYAATLQEKASPADPVIIRIDTNSGHGPSSTGKALEQYTDLWSFLFYNLGVDPKFDGPVGVTSAQATGSH